MYIYPPAPWTIKLRRMVASVQSSVLSVLLPCRLQLRLSLAVCILQSFVCSLYAVAMSSPVC